MPGRQSTSASSSGWRTRTASNSRISAPVKTAPTSPSPSGPATRSASITTTENVDRTAAASVLPRIPAGTGADLVGFRHLVGRAAKTPTPVQGHGAPCLQAFEGGYTQVASSCCTLMKRPSCFFKWLHSFDFDDHRSEAH